MVNCSCFDIQQIAAENKTFALHQIIPVNSIKWVIKPLPHKYQINNANYLGTTCHHCTVAVTHLGNGKRNLNKSPFRQSLGLLCL